MNSCRVSGFPLFSTSALIRSTCRFRPRGCPWMETEPEPEPLPEPNPGGDPAPNPPGGEPAKNLGLVVEAADRELEVVEQGDRVQEEEEEQQEDAIAAVAAAVVAAEAAAPSDAAVCLERQSLVLSDQVSVCGS